MSNDTWWCIEIHHTELTEDPENTDGLLLPVSIQLDVPINRSPLVERPVDPIEIERVFLWNQIENEHTCKAIFHKDDSAWEKFDERDRRTFERTLCIPSSQKPIKELEDALSIEIYDTTSGCTPWYYPITQLTAPGMSSIRIKINH